MGSRIVLHVTHYFINFIKWLCISTTYPVLVIHKYLITISFQWLLTVVTPKFVQKQKEERDNTDPWCSNERCKSHYTVPLQILFICYPTFNLKARLNGCHVLGTLNTAQEQSSFMHTWKQFGQIPCIILSKLLLF